MFVGCTAAVATAGPEVVILKDGFVIQGNIHHDTETIVDKATGIPVQVTKNIGFGMINEGAKFTVFSEHNKQLGAIAPDTKLRPDYKRLQHAATRQLGETRSPPGGNDQDQ